MKDALTVCGLVIGCLFAFMMMIAAVVAFYGAIIGGLIGVAWLVIKSVIGLAP